MKNFFDKTILITGVAGTVGSAILSILAKLDKDEAPKHIIGIDNNETELFFRSTV